MRETLRWISRSSAPCSASQGIASLISVANDSAIFRASELRANWIPVDHLGGHFRSRDHKAKAGPHRAVSDIPFFTTVIGKMSCFVQKTVSTPDFPVTDDSLDRLVRCG